MHLSNNIVCYEQRTDGSDGNQERSEPINKIRRLGSPGKNPIPNVGGWWYQVEGEGQSVLAGSYIYTLVSTTWISLGAQS